VEGSWIAPSLLLVNNLDEHFEGTEIGASV